MIRQFISWIEPYITNFVGSVLLVCAAVFIIGQMGVMPGLAAVFTILIGWGIRSQPWSSA